MLSDFSRSKSMARNVQFVTDANGERTAVILPLDEYEELLEDLHVTRIADETKDEPRRPLTEVVEELRNAGEIDV
jgi:PHD/YefM family antitoxin component YafN of YafNO toxin-antitoxin module